MNQTGIYIHIPFCVRKCQYCDFLSFCSTETEREHYVARLCEEIGKVKKYFPNQHQVNTIFIGGGTPSILSIRQVDRIMESLHHEFKIDPQAEISIECNPGTVTQENLAQYRKLGINRISFGVQSLQSAELRELGRIHSKEDAVTTYEMARRAGFENINLDLMSGIPMQTLQSYKQTLQEVCQLEPEHISAYSLIVEEGTPFFERYADTPPVSEELDRRMYEQTKECLSKYGYDRYEISNYARKGYESRHNLKYWSGEDYIGMGLGASSKIGNVRYKNETDMDYYLQKIQQGKPVHEIEEILSKEDEMAEFFILGLRKMRGVSRKQFFDLFSLEVEEHFGRTISQMKELGLLREVEGMIFLTDQGIDVSNVVFQQFI